MNPLKPVKEVFDALLFPFKAAFVLLICTTINWMTTPGHWWVKWVAFGLGIALIVKIVRAIKVVIITGALAAIGMAAWQWWKHRNAKAT